MRNYAKVMPEYWTSSLCREINRHEPRYHQIVFYLLTNPHANMSGVFYLPKVYLAHDTGCCISFVEQALDFLADYDFCSYDAHHEIIWVHSMLKEQVGEKLKVSDKRHGHLLTQLQRLPALSFMQRFCDTYAESHQLHDEQLLPPIPEAPSKGLTKGHSKGLIKPLGKPVTVAVTETVSVTAAVSLKSKSPSPQKIEPDVMKIFQYWQEVMQHPTARLDEKRQRLIQKNLALYSVSELQDAIDGCASSPYHMGDNERGKRYDSLELIFRHADKIEGFIHDKYHPPRSRQLVKRKGETDISAFNRVAGERWLQESTTFDADVTQESNDE